MCDLDVDGAASNVVGYNAAGDFVIGTSAGAKLAMPAMNQQEGTLVSIDNQLLPTNVGVGYNGYVLNDIACALGVTAEYTVSYTEELPADAGFKAVAFDSLGNFYSALGADERGYVLENVEVEANGTVEAVADLPEFNGTVIYHCDPVNQFNANTAKAKQLEADTALYGSEQFATAAKIKDGESVVIEAGARTIKRTFRVDSALKGTVALNPTFDLELEEALSGQYRFEKAKIYGVSG